MLRYWAVVLKYLCASCLFVALIALNGCIQSVAPPSFSTDPTISFNPNPQAPLAAIVKFETNKPVRTAIRIKDGEWERELLYDASYDPAAGLPIVGMVPDRTHELRVFIHDDFGRLAEAPEPLQFHSLALPQDPAVFPPVEMTVADSAAKEPGILLLNIRAGWVSDEGFSQKSSRLVALNGKGKVVWYYRTEASISDFRRLDNGNIIFITEDSSEVEIDWLGNVQATLDAVGSAERAVEGPQVETLAIPYAVEELPNGNILALEVEQRSIGGEAARGGRVREYSATQPAELIAEVVVRDTVTAIPVGWSVFGFKHLPYIIPCNYCYSYPGPPRPRRRPF